MNDISEAIDFDLADVAKLNAANRAYVEQLPLTELARRMEEITCPGFGDPQALPEARRILREYGIVVFPGVLNTDICANAADAVDRLYGRYAGYARDEDAVFEDEDALFQVGSAKLKGYYKLSNYGKTVVTVRQGQDQGMVDIFNCDIALNSDLAPLRDVFEKDYLLQVINAKGLRPHNLNAYINQEIVATRGFHVDSYAEHLKAFLYMTDVNSLADGPYTYVKRSHMTSPFQRANQNLCGGLTPATETPVVDPMAITPIIAPGGSLVISDQGGSHRGWPQAVGHRRMAAVMKYAH